MFKDLAAFYDLAKLHRNYASEANSIRRLIRAHCPGATAVLEVACGTGSLLKFLDGYVRAGLDISSEMLEVAKSKLGESVPVYQGDFAELNLARKFSALLCLSGAIGYIPADKLTKVFHAFARHLDSGNLLILEPWYSPDEWKPRRVHVVHNTGPQGTLVRVAQGNDDGAIDFHNVVVTSAGIRYFDERYQFFLHSHSNLKQSLQEAGFIDIREDLTTEFKRGLILAKNP